MKKLFLCMLCSSSLLLANNNESMWDKTSKSFDSLWNSTKQISDEAWQNTKKYTNKGKNLVLEETLLRTLNLALNTKDTKIEKLKIFDDDSIFISFILKGEDKNLELNIKNYSWSKTKDGKNIIIEDIEFTSNITWIDYLLKEYLQIHKNQIVLENSMANEALLLSFKTNNKTKYEKAQNHIKKYWANKQNHMKKFWISSDKKDLSLVFSSFFNKEYINIKKLQIKDKNIEIKISLKDTKDLELFVDNFSWATANKRTYIIFKDISLKNTNKIWIKSLLEKYDNSFYFTHTKTIENILKSIKKPIQGKKK